MAFHLLCGKQTKTNSNHSYHLLCAKHEIKYRFPFFLLVSP